MNKTNVTLTELDAIDEFVLRDALEEYAKRRPTRMVAQRADGILRQLDPYHKQIARPRINPHASVYTGK